MADYAPNNTGRYRVRYVAGGQTHSITFRYAGAGSAPALFVAGVETFLGAVADYMPPDLSVIGAFQAVLGSDLFLPLVNFPVWNGVLDPASDDISDVAAFGTFSGLSVAGAKARIQVMGMQISPDDNAILGDYRIQADDLTAMAPILAALRAIPELVAIDGNEILWYSYMNIGYHAHYQRKSRR